MKQGASVCAASRPVHLDALPRKRCARASRNARTYLRARARAGVNKQQRQQQISRGRVQQSQQARERMGERAMQQTQAHMIMRRTRGSRVAEVTEAELPETKATIRCRYGIDVSRSSANHDRT